MHIRRHRVEVWDVTLKTNLDHAPFGLETIPDAPAGHPPPPREEVATHQVSGVAHILFHAVIVPGRYTPETGILRQPQVGCHGAVRSLIRAWIIDSEDSGRTEYQTVEYLRDFSSSEL